MADNEFDKGVGGKLLGVVIIAFIVLAFVVVFLNGLGEFSDLNACEDASCSFDNPSGFCAINSSAEGTGISCPNPVSPTLPLQGLFATVLAIIFAVAIFVVIMKNLKNIGS